MEDYNLITVAKKGYNLDCSLFEHLVTNNIPPVLLLMQQISELIWSQMYPVLKDHASVGQFPDVKGVTKNVVFISHNHKEDGGAEDTTNSNQFEAECTIEVVEYLLLQGYLTSQIVILTPYLGQLLKCEARARAAERN